MQSGTVTVLAAEKELKFMRDSRIQRQIAILKGPKFWRKTSGVQNLRTNSFKGREKWEVQWGYLYSTDCEICKIKNHCTKECKHRDLCKLFVMKVGEGLFWVRKMNANAKLPVRGTSGSGCSSVCSNTGTR